MASDEEVQQVRDEVEDLRTQRADLLQQQIEAARGLENDVVLSQLNAEKDRLQTEVDALRESVTPEAQQEGVARAIDPEAVIAQEQEAAASAAEGDGAEE